MRIAPIFAIQHIESIVKAQLISIVLQNAVYIRCPYLFLHRNKVEQCDKISNKETEKNIDKKDIHTYAQKKEEISA